MQATINGISMYYEVHGMGEPVLFVHGYPLSRRLWEPLREPMADDYRLILPDLRGHGATEASATASMGQFADDLAALLDEIAEDRPVVVVGLSMGGYIAFEFFRRYPERVRALVLADTRAGADTPEVAQVRVETARRVLAEGSGVVAESMGPKLFAAAASDELRSTWDRIMRATPPEGIAAALHAMRERPDSSETLADINRPTLVIVGEEDRITPPADAEAMAAAISGAQLETIPDAGHLSPVEQPQRFAALLLQFLDSLEPLDQQGWPRRPRTDDR